MITLVDFINASAYIHPEKNLEVSLFNREKYCEDELTEGVFTPIELDVRSVAKYANYIVSGIDCITKNDELYISFMIEEPRHD